MDTSTSYLGLKLPHPFIGGASPFGRHLDGVKRLEDAGCAAVVLHSVFEEQITQGRSGKVRHMGADDEQFAETLSHFPASPGLPLGARRLRGARHPGEGAP